MLTERGIEANPDKCAAIIAMRSPTSVKEVWQHYQGLFLREERRGTPISSALKEIVALHGPTNVKRLS